MGFWSMYYANLEYKRRHPWIDYDYECQSIDDERIDRIIVIITILESLGFCALWFWVACPSLF